MADDTQETDQIEQDLAQTRERMDRRLDELGDKLTPNQLMNDALSQVSGGSGSDFTQTLIAKAKANPLPAALTAAGVIWLMASSQRQSARPAHTDADFEARLRTAEAGVVRREEDLPDDHAYRIDEARGMILGVPRDPSDTHASYGERIKEALASSRQALREKSHDLGASASDAKSGFVNRARLGGSALSGNGQSARRALSSPENHSLVLGGAAALAGLVAGLLIPVSDGEEQALGAIAGRLRTKGRGMMQDAADSGAGVAHDAIEAVKGSAQDHGLTAEKPIGELVADLKSGALASDIKRVAQEVATAGKDSAQSRFVGADSKQ